ncbi:MAG: tyrosine-type recombinase/integrase [Flavobacterium sp.]|nr:tyrosine-type recombinase/integrase [Flavobacterium sp.]
MALHFNCLPSKLDTEQINNYLFYLQQLPEDPSESYFKFTVYSLRLAFKIDGQVDKHVALPSIKKDKRLPVVLSREEVRRFLAASKFFKHQVLLALLYGCGLRTGEVRNLKLSDLDFDRRVLHVRKGKGGKDRYVPLSPLLIGWLKRYIESDKPRNWVFNGKPRQVKDSNSEYKYGQASVREPVRQAARKAGILKRVSAHTLRHTFATHLLEDGLDIVSIKNLLGHERIDTTLIYLHVAQYDIKKSFSPLDTLYSSQHAVNYPESTGSCCGVVQQIQSCGSCRDALRRALLESGTVYNSGCEH